MLSPGASRYLQTPLVVRPVGLDDFSAVRHLHATSFNAHAGEEIPAAAARAFIAFVYSPAYPDALVRQHLCGGWIDNELVGTAAWQKDSGTVARIGFVFVRHPGFGIGRRLVAEAEARARLFGIDRFAACTTVNAAGFFERLGYRATGVGTHRLSREAALPVIFLTKDAGPVPPR